MLVSVGMVLVLLVGLCCWLFGLGVCWVDLGLRLFSAVNSAVYFYLCFVLWLI